jgi:hypothetical protein
MHYGMDRLSQILRLKSLTFPDSFLRGLMHLLFENIYPLLKEQWTGLGSFKGTKLADLGYCLTPHIWEQIGLETAEAYKTMPSDFVGAIPDITNSQYKAEFWSFWVQHLGPILLHNHFLLSSLLRPCWYHQGVSSIQYNRGRTSSATAIYCEVGRTI